MDEKNKKVLVRAALNSALAFVTLLVISYVRQVFFDHVPYSPDFTQALVLAACAGVGTYFGLTRNEE